MNAAETAELLGLAAAFDRRTVGRADVLAWTTVLADIPLTAAKAAVTQHYAEETRWIMPADIRQAVRKQRADTAADYQGPGLTAEVPDADPDDPDAYLSAIRTQRTRAANGLPTRRRPVAELVEQLGDQLAAAANDVDDQTPAIRRPGPLGIQCPQCGAAIGRPCRAPNVRRRTADDDAPLPRQRPPHAARRTTANGQTTAADARSDEEQRRATYLRQLEQMQNPTTDHEGHSA